MPDGDSDPKAWVTVTFKPDPGFTLKFDGLTGQEELGRPFLYTVELSSGTVRGNVSTLVGAVASVSMSQSAQGAPTRYLNGIVTRVVSTGLTGGAYHYRVELRPWIWLLTRLTDCAIFQSKSAFQIISELFRANGFSDFEDNRRSGSGDTTLDYCVQYRETSFDFVTRLMETYGIYYFFRHTADQHMLVLADDPNSHTSLTDSLPFVFDQTEVRSVSDHCWQWRADLALHSGTVTLRDYNFTTPSADLTVKTVQPGKHPYGTFEVYEYPGPYDEAPNGHKLTDVRMQAIGMNRAVYEGASNARSLRAGVKFTLENHPDKALNQEYLVTRSAISIGLAEGASTSSGETMDTFRVEMLALPGDVPFRLPRLTRQPMIRGPQTAMVVGRSGDEITTDTYGRVKVKFHWDRSEAQDETASCWIRVAQVWAGTGWGSMVIPRVGQEVVVEFLEGNPDRPLVTGVVYNAKTTVPYPLPDNKTRSTIKSASSPGGNGANELRFEDSAGNEEVFVHAQKDYNKVVLNSETVKIHQDTTMTVEAGNRSVTVSQGNDTHTVSAGNRGVTVSQGNDSLTVSAGDHSITISAGKSSVSAAQSITLTVGANSITIDTTGITINGAQVQVQASATMSVQAGGPLTLAGATIAIN
jgi:type VI secretion system secreted protein VgrG